MQVPSSSIQEVHLTFSVGEINNNGTRQVTGGIIQSSYSKNIKLNWFSRLRMQVPSSSKQEVHLTFSVGDPTFIDVPRH